MPLPERQMQEGLRSRRVDAIQDHQKKIFECVGENTTTQFRFLKRHARRSLLLSFFQDTCKNTMKQTPNGLTPSSSDSERNSHPRTVNLNNISSFRSAAAGSGSPVSNSFRKLTTSPPSPMTREKLVAVLQEALDIINDDDFELNFGQGDEQ
jgi:hypothetical protein